MRRLRSLCSGQCDPAEKMKSHQPLSIDPSNAARFTYSARAWSALAAGGYVLPALLELGDMEVMYERGLWLAADLLGELRSETTGQAQSSPGWKVKTLYPALAGQTQKAHLYTDWLHPYPPPEIRYFQLRFTYRLY